MGTKLASSSVSTVGAVPVVAGFETLSIGSDISIIGSPSSFNGGYIGRILFEIDVGNLIVNVTHLALLLISPHAGPLEQVFNAKQSLELLGQLGDMIFR